MQKVCKVPVMFLEPESDQTISDGSDLRVPEEQREQIGFMSGLDVEVGLAVDELDRKPGGVGAHGETSLRTKSHGYLRHPRRQ